MHERLQNIDETVIKFNGETALRKNCRRIKGEFYEKNIDCFLIEGKWNRINNSLIEFDHETKKYVKIKNSNLISGIINENLEIGKFTPNLLKNIIIDINGENYVAINEFVLPKNYSYDTKYNIWRKNGKIDKNSTGVGYGKLQYRSENKISEAEKIFESTTLTVSKKDRIFWKRIMPYSIGIEYETCGGFIPSQNLQNAGIIPLKDGSLRQNGKEPYEYVTIPIKKLNQVCIIKEASRLLNLYCSHNHTGSLHIHVGGMNVTEHSVVALWRLLQEIQDEMYSYFPDYKFDGGGISGKTNSHGQSYCSPLPFKLPKYKSNYDEYIKTAFGTIYNYLSGNKNNKLNNIEYFNSINKWNIPSRYHFVNIFNLLFTNSHTVEFRIHEATFNLEKIVKWIYVCVAIVKYAENNQRACIENEVINIEKILKESYHSKKAKDIQDYLLYRKEFLKKDSKIHSNWTANDQNFKFSSIEL